MVQPLAASGKCILTKIAAIQAIPSPLINTAGEYKLTFSGTYNAKGNVQAWSAKHGSSITYSFEGDVNSRVVCSVHAGYTPGFDITASTKIKVLP